MGAKFEIEEMFRSLKSYSINNLNSQKTYTKNYYMANKTDEQFTSDNLVVC